jgi:hypothetical protein
MPWDFGAGVAAAAGAGAGLIGDSIKRERNLEDATNLEALKSKVEQEKQARIAEIVGSVSRTKDVQIAGPTEDGSSLGTMQQPKAEHEYAREVGDALTSKGLITDAGKFYDRADRHEDKTELRTTQAAKQKSDDEKWRATFEETKRFHNETLKRQSAQLGLKDKEAKEFGVAVDQYVKDKAQLDMLLAEGGNDPDVIAGAKQDVLGSSLKLKQFRVDVGDQSDLAKHMSLSATLAAVNKTIESKTMAGEDVAEDKKTRDAISKKIGEIATGSKTAGAAPQDVRVGGKVIGQATTRAEADALVAAHKASGGKKPAASTFNGIEANLLDKEYGKEGMIQTRTTLK